LRVGMAATADASGLAVTARLAPATRTFFSTVSGGFARLLAAAKAQDIDKKVLLLTEGAPVVL